MKNLSIRVIIGILFSVIGLVSLFFTRNTLMAASWLSFGNGLVLSDLRFTGIDEKGNTYEKPIPKARIYTSVFLIVLAVLLLIFQIFMDFQKANEAVAL